MTNKTHYVFSTLTAGQVYTQTKKTDNDLPETVAAVSIAGGSNVPDKFLRTPIGVMTAVSDEELSVLQQNEVFQLHVKNGFITVQEKPYETEKVAADMPTRDQSSPLVPEDYNDETRPEHGAPDKPDAPKTPANKRRA